MNVKIATCIRNKGIGKASGKAFDFLTVGGVMSTARGTEYVEFMLDGDATMPETDKTYTVLFSFYPNREKKLSFRVEGLKLAVAAPITRAA